MTYCVAMLLDTGLVFLSDSRTNAGVDQIATFRKATVFQKPGERVMVLQSSGNLAITQTVVSLLRDAIESRRLEAASHERAEHVRGGALRGRGAAGDASAGRRARSRNSAWTSTRASRWAGRSRAKRRGCSASTRPVTSSRPRRYQLLPDRRVEVRQADHRPRAPAHQQSEGSGEVRARVHGLDHPLEPLGGATAGSRDREAGSVWRGAPHEHRCGE